MRVIEDALPDDQSHEFNRDQALALDAENKALMAEIERLRAALKPFADDARHYAAYPEHMENSMVGGMFTLKQLRAAARALEQHLRTDAPETK